MKITAESLKTLPAPAEGEQTFWDDDVHGFGVRVRQSGARSFIFKYRLKGDPTVRRYTIGNAGQTGMKASVARETASNMWAAVRNGKDPQAEKIEDRKKVAHSFGAMVTEYLDHKGELVTEGKRRQRTIDATRHYLMSHCKPLHGSRLDAIGRPELAETLTKIKKAGPVAQARAYAALSDFFTWAVGTRCVLDVNPLATINKPEQPTARDRVLAADELAAIWNACEDDDFGRIVRLLILTLQRRNEIGEVEWREIDVEAGVLHLAAARTKNNRPHDVPLAPLALKLITASPPREVKPGEIRQAVFGQGAGGFSGWSKAKRALDERIAKARKGKNGKPVPLARWTLHDLRRTGCTMLGETLDIAPHVVEAIVNHVSTIASGKSGVAGVYNRAAYAAEKKAALLAWADHVRALASGEARKVIPLRRPRSA